MSRYTSTSVLSPAYGGANAVFAPSGDLGFKLGWDPLTCIIHHLCAMDSQDSSLIAHLGVPPLAIAQYFLNFMGLCAKFILKTSNRCFMTSDSIIRKMTLLT